MRQRQSRENSRTGSIAVSIDEIFNDQLILRSPLFQRHYVWGKDQIDTLWEDIDTILEEAAENKFLGAIVLQEYESGNARNPQAFWIIDGQQRLTTFYLLYLACVYIYSQNGEDDKASDIVRDSLLVSKSDQKQTTKLIPTIPDYKQFNEILGFFSTFDPKLLPGAGGNDQGPLEEAFLRSIEEIDKRVKKEGAFDLDEMNRFVDFIFYKIEFVLITLAGHHDANEVFNRLNVSGEPLGVIDLIRNEVFAPFSHDADEAENIYHSSWSGFENSFNVDGLFDDPKKDLKKTEALRNDYFFPFVLSLEPSTKKAEIFKVLAKKWAKYFEQEDNAKDAAEKIISELSQKVPFYRAISIGENLDFVNSEVNLFIKKLASMPAPSTFYPYFFHLMVARKKDEIDDKKLLDNLKIVEAFLVRRAFLGLEPTGLHAVFKNLWSKTEGDPEKLVENIETNTIEFPDDQRFEEGILSEDLYHRKLCRYIIEQHELSFTDGDILDSFPDTTADHIMPQERTRDWVKVFSPEDYEKYIHTWANLAPLSIKANAEKHTKDWNSTKEKLGKETVFSTTKNLLEDFDEWNVESIKKRGESLVEFALERWPKP